MADAVRLMALTMTLPLANEVARQINEGSDIEREAIRKGAVQGLANYAKTNFASNPRALLPISPLPTFEWSTAAPSSVVKYPSSASSLSDFAPYWRMVGGSSVMYNGGQFPIPATIDPSSANPGTIDGMNNTGTLFLFNTTSDTFYIQFAADSIRSNTGLRVCINNQYTSTITSGSPEALPLPSDYSVVNYLKVTIAGGRAPTARAIRLEVGGPAAIEAIHQDINETIYATQPRQQMIIGGDSWMDGPTDSQYTTPPAVKMDGCAYACADYLGLDLTNVALSGTGWSTASGTAPAMPNHLYDFLGQYPDGTNKSVYPFDPAVILLSTLQNDIATGKTETQILAGFTATLDGLRAAYPYTPIVVTGGFTPRAVAISAQLAAMISAENMLYDAAIARNDPFLRFVRTATSSPRWLTGTSNATIQNNDGNTAWMGGDDDVHLSAEGHVAVGMELARAVVEALNDMAKD